MTGLAEMFVGTIHAFCLELLKTEAPKYLKFEVLNEVQQGLFVDRHSKQSGLTTSTDLAGAALTRYRDTPHLGPVIPVMAGLSPVMDREQTGDGVLAHPLVQRALELFDGEGGRPGPARAAPGGLPCCLRIATPCAS
jgi:DNA helicase II / ATP-dependent DNA helicase PcrA